MNFSNHRNNATFHSITGIPSFTTGRVEVVWEELDCTSYTAVSLVTMATWARLAILPGNHQGKRTVRPTPQQSCSRHCLGNTKIIVRENKRSLDDYSVLMNCVPHVHQCNWVSVSKPHTTRAQVVTRHCRSGFQSSHLIGRVT